MADALFDATLAASQYIQTAGPQGDPRFAFVWTSTLRRLRALQGNVADLAIEDQAVAQSGITTKAQSRIYSLTTPQSELTYVSMLVNPSSLKITQPKRKTRMDTLGGTRWLHFTDRAGSNLDVMTISMSGSTGTISARGGQDNQTIAMINRRLLVWSNLYKLTLEPPSVTGLDRVLTNEIRLQIASNLFPMQFDFIGHFDAAMEYGEDANKPNSVDYSLTFIVERIEPDMDTVLSTMGDIISGARI